VFKFDQLDIFEPITINKEMISVNGICKAFLSAFFVVCLTVPVVAEARPTQTLSTNQTNTRKTTTLPRQSFFQLASAAGVNTHRQNAIRIRIAGTNPALGTNIGVTRAIYAGRTNTSGSTVRMSGCTIPGSRTNWWAEISRMRSNAPSSGSVTLHRH